MARYMVERTLPDGLHIPSTDAGANTCLGVVDHNDPEAIRRAVSRNNLPIDSITRVSVLDPYCYH